MKKLLLFILIIIVGGVVIASRKQDSQTDQTNLDPTPSTQAEHFTLVVLTSDVSVKNPSDAEFRSVTGEVKIESGSEIKTSTSGQAKILYPNKTITTIEEDSYIKIQEIADSGNKSKIELVSGGVWSKIKNALGSSDYYEVETENTVASVRGTIFATEFRNKIAAVYGIESTVRVRARDPIKKQIIEGTDVDVTSGEKTTLSRDTVAPARKALMKQALEDKDFRKKLIKQQILKNFDRDDLNNQKVRQFMQRLRDANQGDPEFIRELIERKLLEGNLIQSILPSRSPFLSPRVSILPKVTPTILASPVVSKPPTPSVVASVPPSPVPTPTVVATKPILEYISPKISSAGQKFSLNGQYFITGRNTSQIASVTIGGTHPASYAIVDSFTMFVTVPTDLLPGTYDVGATTTSGDKLNLSQVLTIQ